MAKEIHCPNCHFEGNAKRISSYGGAMLFIILLIVSIFFWPLFIATGILFIYLVFRPADQICPKCKFTTPIPLKQHKEQSQA